MKQLLVLLCVLIPCFVFSQAGGKDNFKSVAYWTQPYMTEVEAIKLSQFDIVIADLENMFNNRDRLELVKSLGENTKLICYSNPMELFAPEMPARRAVQQYVLDTISKYFEHWWLLQPNEKSVIFWPGMKMLNLSTDCPELYGVKYYQFIARFILKNVLTDSIWDGYFMDNCTPNIAWVGDYRDNIGIDANLDRIRDNDSHLDSVWYQGVRNFLAIIREAKGNDFLLMGNKGTTEYSDVLDGRFFEEFPNDYLGDKRAGGWFQCLDNAEKTGSYTVFQATKDAAFVYASTLLLDNVYFAFGQDEPNMLDVYKDLGKPQGPYFQQNEGDIIRFMRNFEKGTVIIYPFSKKSFVQVKKKK